MLSDFHIENVRCIRGEQKVPIRPITLLVGENSTGKTSFLGCYQVLHNMLHKSRMGASALSDFNKAPFLLGSFRDIASTGKNSHEFKLGAKLQLDNNGTTCDADFRFINSEDEPVVSQLSFKFGSLTAIQLTFGPNKQQLIEITGPDFKLRVDRPQFLGPRPNNILDALYYLGRLVSYGEREDALANNSNYQKLRDCVYSYFPLREYSKRLAGLRPSIHTSTFTLAKNVVGVGPIRSSPKRTYDKYTEVSTQFGENLMRLLKTKESRASPATKLFFAFGKESQMYSDVKVKWTGRVITEPYQVLVKVRGPMLNIMHVGYGVSQVLPIVAEVCATERPTVFLLQQPEVHLHPRSQAALSSFLVNASQQFGHTFIIESHSDYIIDRFRINVRKRELNPKKLSILFFAPVRSNVNIQHIELDDQGNLMNPTKQYGAFFLDEGMQLLGFDNY